MSQPSHGPRFLKLAEEARSRIEEVSPDEAARLVEEGALVLDVREADEYVGGHIPQAVSLPRGLLEPQIEKHAPDPATLILTYCAGGNRGALAAESLQRMGYTSVRSVCGGLRAWREARHEVSGCPPKDPGP
jgi:rhodanese-related sulfurtransferase